MKNDIHIWKDAVRPVVVLGAVCLIVTALLALTNQFTAPVIEKNAREKADASRRVVLEDGADFEPVELDEGLMAEKKVEEVYRAGNGAGYTVTTALNGYDGAVKIMFGVNAQGEIAGMAVLEHNETKGLGERITGSDFQSQFIGKSGPLSLVKGGASGDNEIAALAGATISSTCVTDSANVALEIAAMLEKGES